MTRSQEADRRRIEIATGKIRGMIEEITSIERLSALLLEAVSIKHPASQKVACLGVLRVLVGTPNIRAVIHKVDRDSRWTPKQKDSLWMCRENIDAMCEFLVGWGFPEIASPITSWGELASEDVLALVRRWSEYKSYTQQSPNCPLPHNSGEPIHQLHDQLGRPHIQSFAMDRLSDSEFVVEYTIHMMSYSVPTACGRCGRVINFWHDARMIAGGTFCPVCFPQEVTERFPPSRYPKGDEGVAYFRRAAKLLPKRFMAVAPPTVKFQLRISSEKPDESVA